MLSPHRAAIFLFASACSAAAAPAPQDPNAHRTDAPARLHAAPDRTITWTSFELPKERACALESSTSYRVRDDGDAAIWVDPGEQPVAVVHGYAKRGTLLFPEGERPTHQPVELEDSGIVVRGLVASDASMLRSQRFVSFGGFFAPTVFTALIWKRAHEGRLALEVPPMIGFETATSLGFEARCEDVALGEVKGAWSPPSLAESAGLAWGGGDMKIVSGGKSTPLYDAPGGAIVGHFNAKDDLVVHVYERKNGYVHTSFLGYDELLGWMRERDLRPWEAQGELKTFTRSLGTKLRKRGHARYRCGTDLPFGIGFRERGVFIGLIRAGTPFYANPDDDERISILPIEGTIEPAGGTSWVVRRDDFAACEEIPEAG